MASKIKIPKKVAGIKVPKKLRKGRPMRALLNSTAGREALAAALVGVAGALVGRTYTAQAAGHAVAQGGTATAHAVRGLAEAATGAVAEVVRHAVAPSSPPEAGPPSGNARDQRSRH